MEIQENPIDQYDTPESNAYSELAEQTAEKLSVEDIAAYVFDVNATLNRAGRLRSDSMAEASEAYVGDPDFGIELRQLGTMLIHAKDYRDIQARLTENQDLLRRGVGNRRELAEDVKKDKFEIIDFEHSMREWLTDNGGDLQPSEVAAWLGGAAGDMKWGQSTISGIAGEIAVGKAIAMEVQKGNGLEGVWYTTQEDDARGLDLVVARKLPDGSVQEVGVDVKTVGKNHTLDGSFTPRGHHDEKPVVELSIAASEVGRGFVADTQVLSYQLEMLKIYDPEAKERPKVSAVRHAKSVHHKRVA